LGAVPDRTGSGRIGRAVTGRGTPPCDPRPPPRVTGLLLKAWYATLKVPLCSQDCEAAVREPLSGGR
jgi:hypothetical protein